MDRDTEQLNLLAIFHYVVGGLAALFSFFPLFYSVIGGFLVYAADHPGPNQPAATASLPRLDVYCARRSFLSRRYRNGHLHSDCWSMFVPPEGLFVRARDSLH
jgi:hypothetical protein